MFFGWFARNVHIGSIFSLHKCNSIRTRTPSAPPEPGFAIGPRQQFLYVNINYNKQHAHT